MKRLILALAFLAGVIPGAVGLNAQTFSQYRNAASSSLAATHAPNSGTLTLDPGTGQFFGTPSPTTPIRVVVSRMSTRPNGFLKPTTSRTIFLVTVRSGDTLSGLTVATDEGETNVDQTFVKGDAVEVMVTAGMFNEIKAAISSLPVDASVVHKTTNETISGVKTFSGGISGPGSAITATGGRIGEVAETLAVKSSRTFHVDSFGAVGDGTADDSTAINAAVTAAGLVAGGVVEFGPKTYAIGAPIGGSPTRITLRGVRGRTKLFKLPLASAHGILSSAGVYSNWSFDGIEFDGNGQAIVRAGVGYYYTLPITAARTVRFDRCVFRDTLRGLFPRDVKDLVVEDCEFLGTRPGTFAADTWDPAAVPDARRGSGIDMIESVREIKVSNSRFRFVDLGICASTSSTQAGRDILVTGCSFVNDWWDTPGSILRFTPDAATAPPVITVTRAAGGLTAVTSANQALSFRRVLASGTEFTNVFLGTVEVGGAGFAAAVVGDVIETVDGKRARVAAVASATSVSAYGWESMDTYEPTSAPAVSADWRLVRYYGTIGVPVSDTQVTCYTDPINPFTGERAVADAGLDLTTLLVRVLPAVSYGGIHINAGLEGVRVEGNAFRGNWADQCSIFACPGATVIGNTFAYGQDEGVTLMGCPNSVVSANRFTNSGVSAVFVGSSNYSVVSANSIHNWGLVNYTAGAIDGGGLAMTVSGNALAVDDFPGRGWSRTGVKLYADSTGTLISGGIDRASTEATVDVTLVAAPTVDSITARDVTSVQGTGAANVRRDIPTAGGDVTIGGESLILADGPFGRANLFFGGRTAAFPKLIQVGNSLQVFLADESDYAMLTAGQITGKGTMGPVGPTSQFTISRRSNDSQAAAIYSGGGDLQIYMNGLAADAMMINANGAVSQAMDTMTYAATISLDVTRPNIHKLTATGNATIDASGAGVAGQEITVLIANDATPRTITFGTNFRPSGTLVGTASKAATVRFVSDGTAWYESGRTTGLFTLPLFGLGWRKRRRVAEAAA
jgi:hypothetical protein